MLLLQFLLSKMKHYHCGPVKQLQDLFRLYWGVLLLTKWLSVEILGEMIIKTQLSVNLWCSLRYTPRVCVYVCECQYKPRFRTIVVKTLLPDFTTWEGCVLGVSVKQLSMNPRISGSTLIHLTHQLSMNKTLCLYHLKCSWLSYFVLYIQYDIQYMVQCVLGLGLNLVVIIRVVCVWGAWIQETVIYLLQMKDLLKHISMNWL